METNLKEAAQQFLSFKRIAVAGVSREPGGAHGGNVVYKRLKDRGYDVFAVNPNADEVEGDKAYHDLGSIPGGVDAVVIATTPEVADNVARDCHELGIEWVWMHRSFGGGSVSESAEQFCRANGINVIAGACPCMFDPAADFGHKMMRGMLRITGGLPTFMETPVEIRNSDE